MLHGAAGPHQLLAWGQQVHLLLVLRLLLLLCWQLQQLRLVKRPAGQRVLLAACVALQDNQGLLAGSTAACALGTHALGDDHHLRLWGLVLLLCWGLLRQEDGSRAADLCAGLLLA